MTTANTSTDSKAIFLVEDDSPTVNLYSNRLEQAGFRTASALDAKEACGVLPKLSADLIILDLLLPKRGGFELLEAIRSDTRLKTTPVLVISNAFLPELAQTALRAGGNKVLPKSECTSSELVCVSRQLVGVRNAEAGDVDRAEQLRRELMEGGSAEVAAIRQQCLKYVEAVGSEEGKAHLNQVYQTIRYLSARAGLAGCGKIAQLTGAMEAMLFDQVHRSHRTLSPSSIQTLVKAVDCLDRLFTSGSSGSAEPSSYASVLLVDDDEVCNMANEAALKRANYDPVSATSGSAALDLLRDNTFDLILLDIDMPGMSGIELCQKLRNLPEHQNTPVIFVTLHEDFQYRAKSLLSGGDDFISKPILPLELILKATVFLLSESRPRIRKQQRRTKSPTPPPSAPAAQSGRTETPTSKPQTSKGQFQGRTDGGESKLESGSKALSTFQATVNEKLKYLQEALAEETKRREAVERQAAENAKRRSELEAAIEENQRSQQVFQQMLEQSEEQAPPEEPRWHSGQLNLA